MQHWRMPMPVSYTHLIEDYPNAYRQFENEITLPLHTLLTNEDVEYVTAKYVECVKEETGR